jgi:hypothetical protein
MGKNQHSSLAYQVQVKQPSVQTQIEPLLEMMNTVGPLMEFSTLKVDAMLN